MLTNTSGIIDVMTRNVRISSVTSQHQDYAICCLILTHNTHTHFGQSSTCTAWIEN